MIGNSDSETMKVEEHTYFFFNSGWQTHMPRGQAHRAQIPDSRHTQQDTDEAQVEEGGRGRGRGRGGGGAGIYISKLHNI